MTFRYQLRLPTGEKKFIDISSEELEKSAEVMSDELKGRFKELAGVDYDLGHEKLQSMGYQLIYIGPAE